MHAGVTTSDDLTILDIEDAAWAEFVTSHPDATPFHHPSWAQLLADCYRLRARVAALLDRRGTIIAGMPLIEVPNHFRRRWVSLPFTDRCAPLIRSDEGGAQFAHQ